MFILSISLLLLTFIHHGDFARTATAVLYQNNTNITGGTLTIFQNSSTTSVTITGLIFGLNSTNTTAHGFHVHTSPVSELFPNCAQANDHFNPYNVSHGPITGNLTTRHVGDLGNLAVNTTGAVYVNITDSIIQLYNITQSIINRTIVVHAMYDDGGYTGVDNSNTTGNAGARLLCGLIKLVSDTPENSMAISNIKFTHWSLFIIMIINYYIFSH